MRLPITISKFSNLLFFVHKSNTLTNRELKEQLSAENIDLLFYGKNKKEIWRQLIKKLGGKRTKQIKSEIAYLLPNFVSFWNKKAKHLLAWKQYLQSNQLIFERAIFDTKKLTGVRNYHFSKIPIFLIVTPHNGHSIEAWFSWTPKKSFLVVEIPANLKTPMNNYFAISVIVHEFFHLLLRNNKKLFTLICNTALKNKTALAKLSDGMPERIFLEELLISSFIPEGYLSNKYFKTKIPRADKSEDGLLAWRKFIAAKLRPLSKNYVDNLMEVDKKYINNLMAIVKRNIK